MIPKCIPFSTIFKLQPPLTLSKYTIPYPRMVYFKMFTGMSICGLLYTILILTPTFAWHLPPAGSEPQRTPSSNHQRTPPSNHQRQTPSSNHQQQNLNTPNRYPGPPSGQYLNYQQEKNATPQELIESNLPLIKYFTRRYPDSIYDDVLSTASMALIIAASKYNGSSRFSSYAGLWIRSLTRREARKYSYGSGGPRRPDRAWTQSSKEYYNNNSKISDKKIPQPIALHLLSPSQVLSSECDTIERVSFFESLYDNLPSTLDDFEKIVFMTRTQPREDFTPDLLPYREVCER